MKCFRNKLRKKIKVEQVYCYYRSYETAKRNETIEEALEGVEKIEKNLLNLPRS